jgi:hypothetical protein
VRGAEGGEPVDDLLTQDLRPHYERIINTSLPAYDDESLIKAFRSTVWGLEQQRLRFAKRASAAVLAQIAHEGGEQLAERARRGRRRGSGSGDEADPAAAFVEDMETGLRVHQRLLDRRRGADRPADEVGP